MSHTVRTYAHNICNRSEIRFTRSDVYVSWDGKREPHAPTIDCEATYMDGKSNPMFLPTMSPSDARALAMALVEAADMCEAYVPLEIDLGAACGAD